METNDLCIICLEEFNPDSNIYKLEECEHCFHSDCIMKWFRNNHSECPYCKAIPKYNDDLFFNYFDRGTKIKYLQKYIKKNDNVPKDLIILYDKLKKNKTKLKNNKQKFRDFKKDEDNKDFMQKLKIYKKLRREARGWKIQTNIRKIESEMATYPLIPIFVKIKD